MSSLAAYRRGPNAAALNARARSLAAFAAFATGTWLGIALAAPLALIAGLSAGLAGAAVVVPRRLAPAAFLLALLGLGWSNAVWQVGTPGTHAVAPRLERAEGQTLIEVEGLVRSAPVRRSPVKGAMHEVLPAFLAPADRVRFDVRVLATRTHTGAARASGLAAVSYDAATAYLAPPMRAGDRVRIRGMARAVQRPTNPGEPDFRPIARDRGDAFWLDAGDGSTIHLVPHPDQASRTRGMLMRWLDTPRAGARRALEAATPKGDAGRLVRGLLLGDRADGGLADAFRRVGLAHLLSVSGFHVAVMALVAVLAVRATGDRGALEPLLIAGAIGAYMLIVPVRAPILRAGIMALALLVSDALGRRHDRMAVLAWVGVLVLLLRPTDLISIGFQLSFGLVAWLLIVSHPRPDTIVMPETMQDDPSLIGLLRRGALAACAAAAACWSVSVPLVIYHTGAFPVLAVPATLVAVPLIIVTMWLGALLLIIAGLVPPAAAVLGWMLGWPAGWCASLIRWIDNLPFATLHTPSVSLAWTIAATLAIAYVWRRGRWRSWAMWALLAATGIWFAIEATVGPRLPGHIEARVTMLDVSDGTAILVERGGDALLWDAGSMRTAVGLRTIPDACRSVGAPRVPSIVITHANLDHYLALPDLARPLGVERVIMGESLPRAAQRDPDGAPAFLLAELSRLGIETRVVTAGDTIRLGDASLRILHPPAGFVPRRENDASLVARLEPMDENGPSVLLTGDIQDEAIAMLLTGPESIRADVLELPHHGSARPAAYAFVDRVSPSVVLQSTGPRRLDDPRWDHVRAARNWFVTARDGAVMVDLRRDSTITTRRAR